MKALALLLLCSVPLSAKEAPRISATVTDISYYDAAALKDADEYQKSQCKLDIEYPVGEKGFATLVWFHGGGLSAGKREFPELKGKGIALVPVSYRLAPPGNVPDFIEDAAAATAWTVKHIAEYGGDPKKVFVSGHSAGGYLTLMLGMDPKWLEPHGLSPADLAALIPVSAQVTTHFHVKELLGNTDDGLVPVIDQYSPLHFVSKDLPPMYVITGDRKIEWPSRVEENIFFVSTLKNLKHPSVEFHEMPGVDHGGAGKAAAPLILEYMENKLGK